MTRARTVPGEKPLFWVGTARSDLRKFPEAVKDAMGGALSVAQFGGKHTNAKPWKGAGREFLRLCRTFGAIRFAQFIR